MCLSQNGNKWQAMWDNKSMSNQRTQLQAARESLGLTQVDLARVVGCDSSTICRYEGGSRRGHTRVRLLVAKAVGLPVERLDRPAEDTR